MDNISGINNVNKSELNAAKPVAKETAKIVAPQVEQMTEMPRASLGRDLVNKVEVVRAGDKILETAFDAETKPGKATFTLAKGDEVFPNIWDKSGGNYAPKKGDIIMGYGDVPKDWGISNPNVLKEMEAKGLSVYPDRAVSAEPKLMYETYVGADGRDFTKNPLKYGETIPAEKKIFPTKFMFVKPGTFVETLEAKAGSAKMPVVGEFQYVQIDAAGNPYVKDIKDLTKRLNPKGQTSEEIFKIIKDVIKQRDTAIADGKEISVIWKETLPKLLKFVR